MSCLLENTVDAAIVLAGVILAFLVTGAAFAVPLATANGMAGTAILLATENQCQGLAAAGLAASASAFALLPASAPRAGLPTAQALAVMLVAATLLLLPPLCRSRSNAAAATGRGR